MIESVDPGVHGLVPARPDPDMPGHREALHLRFGDHGGQDVGASVKGTWESLYVYDIMLRTKQLLESSTAARVIATTLDGDGFEIQDRDRLPFSPLIDRSLLCIQYFTNGFCPVKHSDCAISFSWCGKTTSWPPP